MSVKRLVVTMDFEYDGDDRPELPAEVKVFRPEVDNKVGVARFLRYCDEDEDEDNNYCFVKAEITICDYDPNEIYSLFDPSFEGEWKVWAF